MSGSCSGAVNVYQKFRGPAGRVGAGVWHERGGTAVSRGSWRWRRNGPATRLRADQSGAVFSCPRPMRAGLVDVTQGDNTVSFSQNGQNVTVTGVHRSARVRPWRSGVGTGGRRPVRTGNSPSFVDHGSW